LEPSADNIEGIHNVNGGESGGGAGGGVLPLPLMAIGRFR